MRSAAGSSREPTALSWPSHGACPRGGVVVSGCVAMEQSTTAAKSQKGAPSGQKLFPGGRASRYGLFQIICACSVAKIRIAWWGPRLGRGYHFASGCVSPPIGWLNRAKMSPGELSSPFAKTVRFTGQKWILPGADA